MFTKECQYISTLWTGLSESGTSLSIFATDQTVETYNVYSYMVKRE